MPIARKHLPIISAALVFLVFGLLKWPGRYGLGQPGTAKAPQTTGHRGAAPQEAGSANVPPAATTPQASTAPASTETVKVVVKRGESVSSLAWRYLPQTVYMRETELDTAIREANGLKGDGLKPGQQIMVPGVAVTPIQDEPLPVSKNFEARGIYLTGYTAGSARGLDLVKQWKAARGNTVVFDIKDYDGELHVPFEHKYAPRGDLTIRNLPKYIHYLHSLQLHVIARIALFRDAHLAETYPELAVRSRRTGRPWLENGKLAWTDPSNPEVQQYDLDLARMAAAAGADEIQFDYVRFPAEGDQADCEFAYQKNHPDWPRSKTITDFVARAEDDLHARGVLLSIDVFGVMAWARPVDLSHTGQKVAELARHVDVLSPMIYPSHFYGMDGYALPGNAPEHFISESMKRFEASTQGSGVTLRPWLQAFAWRTSSYSTDYILTQVSTSKDEGAVGFLFWNARNEYPKPFDAMPRMFAAGTRYFRGDEVNKPLPAQAGGTHPSGPGTSSGAPSSAAASAAAGKSTPRP
jgi:hypothetical protein